MGSYRSLRLERVEDVLLVDIHNPRNDLNTVDAVEVTTLRREDHKEGLRAVRERRTPRSRGR